MRAALKPAVKFIYYGNMFNKKHNSGDFFNVSAEITSLLLACPCPKLDKGEFNDVFL